MDDLKLNYDEFRLIHAFSNLKCYKLINLIFSIQYIK